ncbi:MAG TPA: cupin domain-containing protein [Pseudomonadales bacterium]
MTSSDPQRHLLRAADAAGAAVRALSGPTGMARLGIEQRNLKPSEGTELANGTRTEGFVYVLTGRGQARCAGESHAVAAGDLLGLSPGDAVAVVNTGSEPLTLLIGTTDRGPGTAP